ncbi:MAG: CusA/CzcA family heavy metal efflux RND transporter [Bacteroidetes bacterium]|nr:CusA/CzcA family heavy metal efflux RND transporter [Bacteroidota bacterium]
MLDQIIRFSIKNKALIGLMTVALIVWGVYSVTQLPIDAVPDITDNQVQVLTVAPSQSAQDIERLVTFPVEQTMATIPGIHEIRSFSRFGLSVVTLVFKEHVDVYWARQQVGERLVEAKALIPEGIGSPEMAPLTTGLGEIYQYVIRPLPGYETKYDAMALRTIQDWIVRRQLLGVEGVADVSSFGGKLKQYEIALNPERLRSMDVSITEVFAALESNNQNTGGSYIDKRPYAWFIRSEGLIENLEDIGNIAVKVGPDGIPVLMRDVAKIDYGFAKRYGAMTRNDEGEVVGAIVMMLKGANSSSVIENVKSRIAQIEKTLPPGVAIEPYLDRTKLVDKAISTVTRNLTEGALIVIFVLVLLLGNLRGGMIVASVIPLAMLFAVAMMNMFGVSGNLMSLGAIDFGLIVDGAVIIVEGTLHHLAHSKKTGLLTQKEMDHEVHRSASKIMASAAFGEIIILIVYLPILALVGVEGKMFKPMAQTVSFAILGAFLLSLTYVPMISAIVLSKRISTKRNISDRLVGFIQKLYRPTLELALRFRWIVISAAVAFLGFGILVFTFLGAEFIPTLEEGDFAVETRVLTGSSMEETISAATRSAKVLKDHFPEVKTVVGKIGSSEIPTDPMPIEACDLIVVLKDKSEWVSAKGREELAEKMQQKLEEHVPGVSYSFQQPIQMRFNELMSGARQDVVVKIYGENLDSLTKLAEKVGELAGSTEGAKDLYVEQVGGLSQIVVAYKRPQIAQFGLTIADVNTALNTAMAGQATGKVYEGERRFDLVVRLDANARQSIEDVRNIPIETPTGMQIPLSVVAQVDFETGPNQIQRDDAKRRIIVGFNVRGRDVESVVEELQQKVEKGIQFPEGYYPTYGGTFENLIAARARLSIAVPVALLLIFLLLFFTFKSFTQSMLIFTAIPLSAIGGILALWTRGMPFSISAGVGFIALFGVAVLNGIVLIAEFNRLKESGMDDLRAIILQGTATRLRPVIMTAAVASLGFLPMAISGSEGAEVQRPLATVVIGGLVTATLLTLVVLPCLYMLFESAPKRKKKSSVAAPAAAMIALLLLFAPLVTQAQNTGLSLQDAISKTLQQHQHVRLAEMDILYEQQLVQASSSIPKLDVGMTFGQYNSAVTRDNNLTLRQTIPFPTTFARQRSLADAHVAVAVQAKAVTQNEAILQLRETWLTLQYLHANRSLLERQDSIFAAMERVATIRFQAGESNLLEKTTAATGRSQVENQLRQNAADIEIWLNRLQLILNGGSLTEFTDTQLARMPKPTALLVDKVSENPQQALLDRQIDVAEADRKVTGSQILPDISVGYFNQTLIGFQTVNGAETYFGPEKRFQGFTVGLGIPLWAKPELAKVKAGKILEQKASLEAEQYDKTVDAAFAQAKQNHQKLWTSLDWFESSGMKNANLMLRQSTLAFEAGEIDHLGHLFTVQQSISIQENYLATLLEYNMNILQMQYLLGNITTIEQ